MCSYQIQTACIPFNQNTYNNGIEHGKFDELAACGNGLGASVSSSGALGIHDGTDVLDARCHP